MKRKVFLLAVFALATGAGVYYSYQYNGQPANDLVRLNVEALAADETSGVGCMLRGCVDCPFTNEKVKYVFF